MNQEQRNFISAVILPKLVEMACDDSLPMDMNEMCYSHFEDEAEEYNKGRERDVSVKALSNLVSDDADESYDKLVEQSEIDGSVMADDIVLMWEPLEGRYTVDQLLDEI